MNQELLIAGIVLLIIGMAFTYFNIGPGGTAFLLYLPAIVLFILAFTVKSN
jgi:Sec-independent protein secretion pathway component TatC